MAEASAWVPLARMFGQKIVDLFPRWIMKRFYPPEAVGAHIHVDVRNVDFRLSDIPHVYLWLGITNWSPYIDLRVDQVIVDIWDSQPLIKLSSTGRPVTRRCTRPKEAVLCEADLTDAHVRRLRERKGTSVELRCHVHAFFETVVGPVEWRNTITVGETIRFAG